MKKTVSIYFIAYSWIQWFSITFILVNTCTYSIKKFVEKKKCTKQIHCHCAKLLPSAFFSCSCHVCNISYYTFIPPIINSIKNSYQQAVQGVQFQYDVWNF